MYNRYHTRIIASIYLLVNIYVASIKTFMIII